MSSGLATVFVFLFNVGFMVGPHVGYIVQGFEMNAQYRRDLADPTKLDKADCIKGYAALVSLLLLAGNTLRIFYFMGNQFSIVLLIQSVLAVLAHLSLLLFVTYVHHRTHHPPIPSTSLEEDREEGVPQKTDASALVDVPTEDATVDDADRDWEEKLYYYCIFQFSPKQFFFKYCYYVMWFAAVYLFFLIFAFTFMGATNHISLDENSNPILYTVVVEGVGYAALGLEAMLVLPQIMKNHKNRSTKGLSIVLILTWVLGDLIKMVYFVLVAAPLPFLLCGTLQLIFDAVLLFQFFTFPRSEVPSARSDDAFYGNVEASPREEPQNPARNSDNNHVLDDLFRE